MHLHIYCINIYRYIYIYIYTGIYSCTCIYTKKKSYQGQIMVRMNQAYSLGHKKYEVWQGAKRKKSDKKRRKRLRQKRNREAAPAEKTPAALTSMVEPKSSEVFFFPK